MTKNVDYNDKKIPQLALLIDDDNASIKDIPFILNEITKYGEATLRRIYGNFVGKNGNWKETINTHAIKPMQQFAYTTGKNATDGYMMIDTMDLLYKNLFDGFCIVSSDSDFTALAIRLKEEGVKVYGFGRKQTPESFRNACSHFIYVENLRKNTDEEKNEVNNASDNTSSGNSHPPLPKDTLNNIFEEFEQNDWIHLGLLGQKWRLLENDFDPRNYGCKKLSDLVKKYPDIFEIKTQQDSGVEQLYVRLKNI
ncbi:NYN domain-containing protein [Avibacterium paragallinarum]|uniref:NYN domain-containing protein n=1 Tax=Avibacterium paragallinarum TaxID=728 RepID=UPI002ED92202